MNRLLLLATVTTLVVSPAINLHILPIGVLHRLMVTSADEHDFVYLFL